LFFAIFSRLSVLIWGLEHFLYPKSLVKSKKLEIIADVSCPICRKNHVRKASNAQGADPQPSVRIGKTAKLSADGQHSAK